MNNILDEITYSDGRMENGCTSSFVDSPAKLKLRARTYDGIKKSVESRRTPIVRDNKFEIPNSYMAMDIPNGENGGGNSLYTTISSVGLEQPIEVLPDAKMRRVRVNDSQIRTMRGNTVSEQMDTVTTTPVEDTVVSVEQPKVEVTSALGDVTPSVPAVESTNVVEDNSINDNSGVMEKAEMPKQEMSFDQQYDKIREKLEQNETHVEEPVKEEDPIDNAMQSNYFSEVEKTRTKLIEVDQAYLDSETAKSTKNEKLLKLNAAKEEAISRETDARRVLAGIYQENDTAIKREEEAKQLRHKLEQELRNQVKLMKSVIEKRHAQIKENEEDMKQLDSNISEREQEIAAVENNTINLQKEGEVVSKKTSELLEAVGRLDNENLKIQEIIDANKDTKSMEMQNEIEQYPTIETSDSNNVVPFPNFESSVYEHESGEEVVSASDDKVYSYGRRTA